MPELRAVIFDMDGLLIDTEPIWRRSEVEVFGSVGLHLREEQCLETMGVRIDEVVRIWHDRFPWNGPSCDQVARRIEQRVIEHVEQQGEPKPGALEALRTVRGAGLPIAIASSSTLPLIRAVVGRLGIAPFIDAMCSGADELEGKPHPAVYLRTASRLGVPPQTCLALEDSPNGVLSAKRAGMVCIVVPDPYLKDDPRMARADLRLTSLEDFTPELLEAISERQAEPTPP